MHFVFSFIVAIVAATVAVEAAPAPFRASSLETASLTKRKGGKCYPRRGPKKGSKAPAKKTGKKRDLVNFDDIQEREFDEESLELRGIEEFGEYLERRALPKTLYHITDEEAARMVKKYGIDWGTCGGDFSYAGANAIYLGTNDKTLKQWWQDSDFPEAGHVVSIDFNTSGLKVVDLGKEGSALWKEAYDAFAAGKTPKSCAGADAIVAEMSGYPAVTQIVIKTEKARSALKVHTK